MSDSIISSLIASAIWGSTGSIFFSQDYQVFKENDSIFNGFWFFVCF